MSISSPSPLGLARAGLLCLALLLSQWLGQVHAVAHAGGAGAATAAGAVHAHAPTAAHGAWAGALGGEHQAGDTECRLIDQLSHSDAPGAWPATLALPPPAAEVAARVHPVVVPGSAATPYLARAPPRA